MYCFIATLRPVTCPFSSLAEGCSLSDSSTSPCRSPAPLRPLLSLFTSHPLLGCCNGGKPDSNLSPPSWSSKYTNVSCLASCPSGIYFCYAVGWSRCGEGEFGDYSHENGSMTTAATVVSIVSFMCLSRWRIVNTAASTTEAATDSSAALFPLKFICCFEHYIMSFLTGVLSAFLD